jgi:hypothetical protein
MAMATNESIIAVPPSVEQPGQTRQFLVRLVEQIDIVLGRRGGDPYVSASDLLKTQSGLSSLELQVLAIVERALTADGATSVLIEELLQETTAQIDALKSSSTVTDANTTPLVYSGPPTKSEVEALDAREAANSAKFNSLLTALRETGIIAT